MIIESPVGQAGQPRHRGDDADRVQPGAHRRARLGHERQGREQADQGDGDVHEEDPAPPIVREQPAAQDRADDRRDQRGHRPEAQGERALALCPKFVDIRTKLGTTFREMGDIAAAVREFERVKVENPKFVGGRLHLGLSYYAQGRRAEAAEEWQEVLAMAPENKSAHMYLAMVRHPPGGDGDKTPRPAVTGGDGPGDPGSSKP